MKIEYSPYILQALSPLNARMQSTEHEGALLKVTFHDGIMGYADCHPWPELGDCSLTKQLGLLSQKKTTPLLRCSLQFARLDGEAREQALSLLASKPLPNSHFLIVDLFAWTAQGIAELKEKGYSHIKIKLGRQLSQEINLLLKLFSGTSFKLRLDFNEKLSFEEFKAFLQAIAPLKSAIDFIEDPFPFHSAQWKWIQEEEGVALACDRQVASALQEPESASYFIFKPAIHSEELWKYAPAEKIIMTSYLDHPLGQIAATLQTSNIDPKCLQVHGLLSHHVYQPNQFSQPLSWEGPRFLAPSGTGFGYDNELEQLEWKAIS